MTRKASYALRVCGHSMIGDQIQDGDIIIEQPQTAENGETVVALINGAHVRPHFALAEFLKCRFP